ncbi:MAG: hypothetical protein LBL59_04210 [Xanthomonadaceae bacterium]|jgi:hypothetical protein|nr:hypothetical protein [Xanthomonadaceae bacterium]
MALAISGCAGTTTKSGPPASEEPELGLEQLLSLPVQQGRAGLDQVAAFFYRRYAAHFKNGRISYLDTEKEGELVLADGYILLNVSTSELQLTPKSSELITNVGKISFAVSETPCFPLERFIQISGDKGLPPGAFVPSNYKRYRYRGADVDISASVRYPDFECVYFVNLDVIN